MKNKPTLLETILDILGFREIETSRDRVRWTKWDSFFAEHRN